MRSTQDPIRGLQRYIEEWGIATEQELKVRFFFSGLPCAGALCLHPLTRSSSAATRQKRQGRGGRGSRGGQGLA